MICGQYVLTLLLLLGCADERLSPMAADIKLETESEACGGGDPSVCGGDYSSRHALKRALGDWHEEFMAERHPNRRFIPPQVQFSLPPDVKQFESPVVPDAADKPPQGSTPPAPSPDPGMNVTEFPSGILLSDETTSDMAPGIPISDVPTGIQVPEVPEGVTMPEVESGMPVPDMLQTCTVSTPTVITPTMSIQGHPAMSGVGMGMPYPPMLHPVEEDVLEAVDSDCTSVLQPLAQPVNALAEEPPTDLDGLSDSGNEGEAMDCVPSSTTHAVAHTGNTPMSNGNTSEADGSSESLMQVDAQPSGPNKSAQDPPPGPPVQPAELVTLKDISLLPELFYMPFEHGTKALDLMTVVHWLLDNVGSLHRSKRGTVEVNTGIFHLVTP